MKQSSLDDHESLGMELEGSMSSDNGDELSELNEYEERRAFESGRKYLFIYMLSKIEQWWATPSPQTMYIQPARPVNKFIYIFEQSYKFLH